MKVAIYARVSTDDHDQDNERQILKNKQYCDLHAHEILGVFQDVGISGDTDPWARNGFKEAVSTGAEGIICFSIDRISRQHPSRVIQFLSACKDRGIKIISITEPMFNMEGEFSDLLQYFLAWWNNYFLKKLKRDIVAGMDKARIQGTRSGKPIGHPRSEFNKHRAYYLLVNGMSQRQVAKELGVSLATINRFRKVASKNPEMFIKDSNVTNPNDKETAI